MPKAVVKSKPLTKSKSGLANRLNSKTKAAIQKQAEREPPWSGPCSDGPKGGVTQSLLAKYLTDKERFRLLVMEGLQPIPSFNHRLSYGEMWHLCEEVYARSGNPIAKNPLADAPWLKALKDYCQGLCRKWPMSQEQVVHWYEVCKAQFPAYVRYWAKHPDVKHRMPLLQEQVFHVPYALPSGRVVYLRGKWDSVDLVGKGKDAGIYLTDHKTKGDIDEVTLHRQLVSGFELQTGAYLVALCAWQRDQCEDGGGAEFENPIRGFLYNVIRRPLSGGKFSIRQNKPSKSNPEGESSQDFYARLKGLIEEEADAATKEKRDCWFFMRWKVDVLAQDIERFRRQCLDPVLENLFDDWQWWEFARERRLDVWDAAKRASLFPDHYQRHFRMPYFYSALAEGGMGEIDEYLSSGSLVGLNREADLFKELAE